MNYSRFLGMCSATVLLLTACGHNSSDLTGKWMQSVPGQPNIRQGIVLEENGKASSVNMYTLQYEAWEQQDDRLILSGKSVGNHQTIPFQDTLIIERLTPDSLIARKGNLTLSYVREE